MAAVTIPDGASVNSAVLQGDGKFVVGGTVTDNTTQSGRVMLARFMGDACSIDAECEDDDPCRQDLCDGLGACVHPAAALGTPCATDGSLCTADECDGAGVCAHVARPDSACLLPTVPGAAQLKSVANGAGKLVFNWKRGPIVPVQDFGAPGSGATTYELCVYDDTSAGTVVARNLFVVGDSSDGLTCGAVPCWKNTGVGWAFKFKGDDSADVSKLLLKQGLVAGKAKAQLKGPTPLPLFLEQSPKVIAQLRASNGKCWGAEFSTAIRNDGAQFKAKSD
jgi:hypothetical protein